MKSRGGQAGGGRRGRRRVGVHVYVHRPGLSSAHLCEAARSPLSLGYRHPALRKYAYGLSDTGVANGAFGLAPFTDPVGTFHTEQVVSTRDQGSDDLAFKAHRTVAAALPTCARGRGGGRGGRGGGRGVKGDPGEVGARQGGDGAGVTREREQTPSGVTAYPPGERVLARAPGVAVERRRQSGLRRTAAEPSLTRRHPVGISGEC